MPKFLLTFEKNESVRWLGHLDILRTFERAIRRAGLPIAFSGGYNPRERLAFASALSTGVTGGAEPAVLELNEALPPCELVSRLNAALPPGIRILTGEPIPDAGSRDLLNSFNRAVYQIVCACPPETTPEQVESAIAGLLAQPQICIKRERENRVKTVDIRPFLYELRLLPESVAQNRLTLEVQLGLGENVNAKPGEVIASLADTLPGLTLRRAHRARLLGVGSQVSGAGENHSPTPGAAPPETLFPTPNA